MSNTTPYVMLLSAYVMHPLDGPPAVVRTDPAPGFKALTEDQQLKHHRITKDLRHAKNHNKNPVAERVFKSSKTNYSDMIP